MKSSNAIFVCALAALVWLVCAEANAASRAGRVGWRTDFRAASRAAAQQRKPMLVVVTAPWCGFCRRMFQETFTDANVIAQVGADYLPVMIDFDTNPELTEKLQAYALPTTLVISSDNRILSSISGYQTSAELRARLTRYAPRTKMVQAQPMSEKRATFVEKYVARQYGPAQE